MSGARSTEAPPELHGAPREEDGRNPVTASAKRPAQGTVSKAQRNGRSYVSRDCATAP
jgi:hypothetical protein